MVQKGALRLHYTAIDEKIVDVLTKPLLLTKYRYFGDKLGMAKNVPLDKREYYSYNIMNLSPIESCT